LLALVVLNCSIASWTFRLLIDRHFGDGNFPQTVDMNLMEAFRSLQHSCIHFLHFSLSNLSVTKFAKFIFFILLHLFVVRLSPFSLSMVHELFKSVSIYFFLSFWVLIHWNLFIHIHISFHREILVIVHFIFFYLLHFFSMISHKAVGS
jgi:hypothetical protein